MFFKSLQAPAMLHICLVALHTRSLPLLGTPSITHVCYACTMQGPQAHAAGVEFPDDELDRYLLIGNLNPIVTADQVCMLHCHWRGAS